MKKNTSQDVERTTLVIPREDFIEKLNKRIGLAENLFVSDVNQLEQIEQAYYKWDEINKEIIKQSFSRPDSEHYYKHSKLNTMVSLMDYTRGIDTSNPYYKLDLLKTKINGSVDNLKLLIEKSEFIDDVPNNVELSAKKTSYVREVQNFSHQVFLVHGHNEGRKLEVARFLEKYLGKTAIILHEQPNKGRTIIEKFEQHSSVDFALALWTADDYGKGKAEEDMNDRARQNVIFETGFFIGKLGRSKVIVLYELGVEIPSDYSGIIFIPFIDNWKEDLRKEVTAIYN